MPYPRLEVSLDKIKHNTTVIVNNCKVLGIKIIGVNKVSCGSIEMAQAMISGGIDTIADSRIENLKKIQDLDVDKMLLRLPAISKIQEVVRYSDISLNSEIKTIRKLSEVAISLDKIHKIILMVDVGDLREGIFSEEEIIGIVGEILNLKGVRLVGLGTNLTCFGAIMPSYDNLGRLVDLKNKINKLFNIELKVLSGGNSSSYHLIQKGQIPKGINQLRLGTTLISGIVEVNDTKIEDTYDDAFKLTVEMIEVKKKPSQPIGEIGLDAFGNRPMFQDIGIRKRAICAIGKQDVDFDWMVPLDQDIKILGGSSDHLILDVTDCINNYEVGDKVTFKLNYVAILRVMTSEYIYKLYID